MGVGRVHRDLTGLARTLGEAGDAARLAATRAASGHFVHVDRLGLGRLLLAWTRTDTFLPAARSLGAGSPALKAEYDRSGEGRSNLRYGYVATAEASA